MIGGKKKDNHTESVETVMEEPIETTERRRVRRRVNTRTTAQEQESPMGFSFGQMTEDEDEDDTEPVKESAESIVSESEVKEPAEESVEEPVEESVVKLTETSITESVETPMAEPEETSAPAQAVVEEVSEETAKRRSDAQKSLDRILAGGDRTRRDSLLRRVQNVIAIYNSRNSGVASEDIQVRYYHDNMSEVLTTEDGRLILPNQRIYYRGFTEEWDRVNEVRVPNGAEFELDLGIGIFLPDGYELELAGVRELRTKYELELVDGVVHLSRQNAMFSIVVPMRAVGDMSYIQKHKSLIQARLVRV